MGGVWFGFVGGVVVGGVGCEGGWFAGVGGCRVVGVLGWVCDRGGVVLRGLGWARGVGWLGTVWGVVWEGLWV